MSHFFNLNKSGNYLILVLLVGLFIISGCGKKETPKDIAEPDEAEVLAKAPDVFKVKFETSKGDFVVEFNRSWSPNGVDRAYYLMNHGFYEDVRFFRVIKGFMAQFGYHGDPKVIDLWSSKTIQDDPVVESNRRGYVTFAKSALPNSRSTQLYINYADNTFLDESGFSPVGHVIEGMDVVDNLYGGYGEGAPRGTGPSQAKIRTGGNDYLKKNFPELDYIKKTVILTD